jgi:CheY-like chemotaxis protein
MDGLAAANVIRTREQGTGRHLPIIAMTAHAMKGDRERCLQAGMDAYVSKPIQARELLVAIAGIMPTGKARNTRGTAGMVPRGESHLLETGEEVLDRKSALKGVQNDRQLLGELVQLFRDECPRWLGEMRTALAQRDPRQLNRAAHTLKGAVGALGAHAAFAAALRLETLGQAGDLTDAASALARLEDSLVRLEPALTRLMEEDGP